MKGMIIVCLMINASIAGLISGCGTQTAEPHVRVLETEEEIVYFDMLGTVVEKLPEDEYDNHYNVQSENDEIVICKYNGDDELNPGDIVWMYQMDDGGWTIEIPDAK